MHVTMPHAWNLSPKQAIEVQQALREEVISENQLGSVRLVAGVDVGFEQGGSITRAAIAVLTFPELQLVDHAIARIPTAFPYVPGLLSFREIPAVLLALEKLKTIPDLLIVDGQGIAHPRRIGIACHLGVLTGLPAIGVAKTRLIGTHDNVPNQRGAWTPLYDGEETIGAVLRTKQNVKPVFVSIGHRVSLQTAIHYALACVTRYRLPQTTRFAHHLASHGEVPSARR